MKNLLLVHTLICITFSCSPYKEKEKHKRASTVHESNTSITALEPIYKSAEKLDFIRSFIVWKNNKILGEKYFQSYPGDSLDHVRSVTKSVMSILIGIAIDQNRIGSVNDPIFKYLGKTMHKYDQQKQNITIKHLLTMMSGFKWDESSVDEFNNWMRSSDQIHYLLNRKISHNPGTKFSYNSANSHLLSVILTNATNMSTLEFANQYLFKPLNIDKVKWGRVSQGYYNGGAALEIKPLDLLKIGIMMLNKGQFNGNRIVSESWVKESTKAYFTQSKEDAYGYSWWLQNFEGKSMYTAAGFGGQYLIVNPELDAVCVITSQWRNRNGKGPAYQQKLKKVLVNTIQMINSME